MQRRTRAEAPIDEAVARMIAAIYIHKRIESERYILVRACANHTLGHDPSRIEIVAAGFGDARVGQHDCPDHSQARACGEVGKR